MQLHAGGLWRLAIWTPRLLLSQTVGRLREEPDAVSRMASANYFEEDNQLQVLWPDESQKLVYARVEGSAKDPISGDPLLILDDSRRVVELRRVKPPTKLELKRYAREGLYPVDLAIAPGQQELVWELRWLRQVNRGLALALLVRHTADQPEATHAPELQVETVSPTDHRAPKPPSHREREAARSVRRQQALAELDRRPDNETAETEAEPQSEEQLQPTHS